jgi:hypothetical protein
MISPTIRPVPSIEPIQSFFFGFSVGGTTSATGTPNRVIRMGLRVLRTRSRTARHVALNLEMAISSMAALLSEFNQTIANDHGQVDDNAGEHWKGRRIDLTQPQNKFTAF